MRLRVVSVGQRMPGWVSDAWEEYARRMPRELSLELREIPLQKRGKNADLARLKRDEGRALLAATAAGDHLVALDGGGKAWSTAQLAANLENWMGQGRDCAFLVGGRCWPSLAWSCSASFHTSRHSGWVSPWTTNLAW